MERKLKAAESVLRKALTELRETKEAPRSSQEALVAKQEQYYLANVDFCKAMKRAEAAEAELAKLKETSEVNYWDAVGRAEVAEETLMNFFRAIGIWIKHRNCTLNIQKEHGCGDYELKLIQAYHSNLKTVMPSSVSQSAREGV